MTKILYFTRKMHRVREKKGPTVLWGHNFDKLKYIVVIFARNITKIMRNY